MSTFGAHAYSTASAARRFAGALDYAADVFASIAGADGFETRSYAAAPASARDCDEAEREWAALLRDLQLRDESLPALVVRARGGSAMFLTFGRHGGPLAVIRLDVEGQRGFRPAQIAETRRFLDEHGAAITHWVVDGDAPQWRRNSAPVSFVIDEQLRPVLAEEPAEADSPLHALYRPRAGHVPPLLADTLAQLVREVRSAASGASASRALPFAFVRLARLVGGSAPFFLVTVEPARRRATVLRAMTRYGLSRRESQVLGEVLRGASSTEIGESLSISSSTATFHLKQLLRKTSSRNRTELTSRVLGWEELN
ncbi:MAG TPA: helix-turn-helix transcriptional regulator [Candidatus Elarobacter sp.]|jgi:DNA-binding CsgD family transcriptional regulator|nr:helix-turn-helix transcriptional regulator [Candidatus Elarobacter sp.]